MADEVLGTISVELDADTAKLTKGIEEIKVALANMAKTSEDAHKKIKDHTEGSESATKKLAEGFETVKKGIEGFLAIEAIKILKDQIMECTEAFAEEQQQLRGLSASIEGLDVEKFEKLANHIQETSTTSKDAVMSAGRLLGQFGLTGDQITEMMPALNQYAAMTGKTLPEAAETWGRAIITGMDRSHQLGGVLGETNKVMFTTGDYAERAGMLIEGMGRKGDVTTATVQTASGAQAQMNNAWHEMQVVIGGLIDTPVAEFFHAIKDAIQGMTEMLKLANVGFKAYMGDLAQMLPEGDLKDWANKQAGGLQAAVKSLGGGGENEGEKAPAGLDFAGGKGDMRVSMALDRAVKKAPSAVDFGGGEGEDNQKGVADALQASAFGLDFDGGKDKKLEEFFKTKLDPELQLHQNTVDNTTLDQAYGSTRMAQGNADKSADPVRMLDDGINAIVDAAKNGFKEMIDGDVKGGFTDMISGVGEAFRNMADSVAGQMIGKGAQDVGMGLLGAAGGGSFNFDDINSRMVLSKQTQAATTGAGNVSGSTATNMVGALAKGDVMGGLTAGITGILTGTKSFGKIMDAVTKVVGMLSSALNPLMDAIVPIINIVVELVQNAITPLKQPIQLLSTALKFIAKGIQMILSAMGHVRNTIIDFVDKIVVLIPGIGKKLKEALDSQKWIDDPTAGTNLDSLTGNALTASEALSRISQGAANIPTGFYAQYAAFQVSTVQTAKAAPAADTAKTPPPVTHNGNNNLVINFPSADVAAATVVGNEIKRLAEHQGYLNTGVKSPAGPSFNWTI